MKAQDKHLYELFQQLLENPEQAAPLMDSSARSGKGVEDMTDLVDLADRLRERSTPVHNAEVALSRARMRILASMPAAPVLADARGPAPAPRPLTQSVGAESSPWEGVMDLFRSPLIPAWATASIAILLLVFATTYMGVVFSANAMPGDATYPIKLFVEQVSLALSFDPVQKAERLEAQNNERLREVQDSFEKGVVVTVTFTEAIQGREGDYWIIGGIKVLVDEGEELLESLGYGARVHVKGIASADGVIQHGVITGPTPTPVIVATPRPDSLLPGTSLDSQPTDTPAPLPTKKPTRKPTSRAPAKPYSTKKPRPTKVVATATPTATSGDGLTPPVDLPAGTVTATPDSGETPEATATPEEGFDPTQVPDNTPPVATEPPVEATLTLTPTPNGTTAPPETTIPTSTPAETPVPDASPTPQVTDTPEVPTPTPATEDTATPLPADTLTPPPVDTPTPPPADTPTPVTTEEPPTNTPIPPPPTSTSVPPTNTPVPPPPTNTPVPPTNTPVPPPPTSTPAPPPPTNTPVPPPPPTSTPVAREPTSTPP